MKLYRVRALAVTASLSTAVACFPSVTATNPYDPATPIDEQAKGRVSGIVGESAGQNSNALALPGVTLVLTGPAPASTYLSTTADGAGNYSFANLTPGSYVLSVTQASVYSTNYTLSLAPGQQLTFPILVTPISSGGGSPAVAHIFGVAEKEDVMLLPLAAQDNSGILVQLQGVGVRTVTDTQGNFDFFVNPGVYTVEFAATNYAATSVANVTGTANQNTMVPGSPIVLQPNPGVIVGALPCSRASKMVAGAVSR